MKDFFIICDNLVRIYKVADLEVVALQGLNLKVAAGEMVGIVGASGSGKTTLMNILGALDRPSAGRVWINGEDLLKLNNRELDRFRSDTVGFVWQESSRNLLPFLSAIENVQMPIHLTSGLKKDSLEYCEHLLESVGMADRMQHKLGELSGGQQQRVAISVALANRPKLLLADEPTGEVDNQTADEIYDLLHWLNNDLTLTTLIVSHDPGITSHVDRVVAIRDGLLATETVRQRRNHGVEGSLGEAPPGADEDVFEELIVLDSTGRLQIPKDLREQHGLNHRVKVEAVEEGILIRPVDDVQFNEDVRQIDEWEERQIGWLSQRIAGGVERLRNLTGQRKKPEGQEGDE